MSAMWQDWLYQTPWCCKPGLRGPAAMKDVCGSGPTSAENWHALPKLSVSGDYATANPRQANAQELQRIGKAIHKKSTACWNRIILGWPVDAASLITSLVYWSTDWYIDCALQIDSSDWSSCWLAVFLKPNKDIPAKAPRTTKNINWQRQLATPLHNHRLFGTLTKPHGSTKPRLDTNTTKSTTRGVLGLKANCNRI